MASEFLGFENAILDFKVPTDDTAPDAAGNPSPVYEIVSAVAFLKVVTDTKTERLLRDQPRIEDGSLAIEGYCVNPMILPTSVTPQMEAWLTFNEQGGKFLLVLVNPPYGREGIGALIEAEAGTKIAGWFTPDR